MRAILFLILMVLSVMWFADFVKSGQLEGFLDAHPKPEINSPVEYGWAVLDDLANNYDTAERRYRRVITRYPDTDYAPLAWISLIDLLYRTSADEAVIDECQKFLKKYPDHPKASIVRKKIVIIHNGL